MWAPILVAGLLGPPGEGPATGKDPPPVDAAEQAETLDRIVADVHGVDVDALQRELLLRLPEVEIVRYAAGIDPGQRGSIYASIRRVSPEAERAHLELITSDGRAYVREVDLRGIEAERALAIEVANLADAIEDDAVMPDREDAEPPPPPEPEPEPQPEPQPEPEPQPDPQPEPEPEPEPRPVPPWEIGASFSGAFDAGVGPPAGGDRISAGGGVTLDLRSPRGVLVALDFRGLRWRTSDYGLGRFRFGLGGGYGLRRGAFEVGTVMLATVEPWIVTGEGRDALREPDGSVASPGPLLGLALRLAPGYRHRFERLALRVGGFAELAGSGVADNGLGVPRIADVNDPDARLFRVGGLELVIGLTLGAWLPVGDAQR